MYILLSYQYPEDENI